MEENTELKEIVLTDLNTKSNKKISYFGEGGKVTINTSNINPSSFLQYFSSLMTDIFLPKGYPESVSKDYLQYQLWDTCQAFCSSISGTLAMRAVMEGIGVGSEAATPVSAAVTWIIKDGTGIVGSILFAWLKGSKLDSDCKKWRLFADILNDIALFIELYIPHIMEYSMHMLCVATVLKALVGTAGSSTRAALITHQAIKENIADVSAKDGSQEIFVNLCAFVFGIFLLKNITEGRQIWTIMCTATLFHLIFNYKAVKCLQINVFNKERFRLSLIAYLPASIVPSVKAVNKTESVFLFKGISDKVVCGFTIVFGACLKNVIKGPEISPELFSEIMSLFGSKKYIIFADIKHNKLFVSFQRSFNETDVLKSYFHAYLLAISLHCLLERKTLRIVSRSRKHSPIYRLKNMLKQFYSPEADDIIDRNTTILLQAYGTCEDFVEKEFIAFCTACEEEEWNLNKHLINIDDWRTEWKAPEKKRMSVRLVTTPTQRSPKTSRAQRARSPQMQVLVIS